MLSPSSLIPSLRERIDQATTPEQVWGITYDGLQMLAVFKSVAGITRKFHADWRNVITLGLTGESSVLGLARGIVKEAIRNAYLEGLKEGGITAEEMKEGLDPSDEQRIQELTDEQMAHVTDFVRDIREARKAKDKAAQRDLLDNRLEMWTNAIQAAGLAGLNSAKANEMVVFDGPDGQESCRDCQRFKKEPHRRKWFEQKNLVPGKPGSDLECGGWKCEHTLAPAKRG